MPLMRSDLRRRAPDCPAGCEFAHHTEYPYRASNGLMVREFVVSVRTTTDADYNAIDWSGPKPGLYHIVTVIAPDALQAENLAVGHMRNVSDDMVWRDPNMVREVIYHRTDEYRLAPVQRALNI